MSTNYIRPHTLDRALAWRAAHPDHFVLAGGTDLLVGAAERPAPPGILDLFGLNELTGVQVEADGTVVIGAATPYAALLEDARIQAGCPLLATAMAEIGAVQVQSRGTIGGNLVTASPVGDTLPVLLALDAEIVLASTRGRRVLATGKFLRGYRRTALLPDELVIAVRIPAGPAGRRTAWRKVGTRRAQSIAKVAMAAAATLDGGRARHVRIAFGAMADRALRFQGVEGVLEGQAPGPGLAADARAAVAAAVAPIDDARSTASYRRLVAGNLVARFVLDLEAAVRAGRGG